MMRMTTILTARGEQSERERENEIERRREQYSSGMQFTHTLQLFHTLFHSRTPSKDWEISLPAKGIHSCSKSNV